MVIGKRNQRTDFFADSFQLNKASFYKTTPTAESYDADLNSSFVYN